jgi:NlpC/P60 family putative phage cell wall peptidase
MTPVQQKIVKAARSWIGTPYQHQASQFGVGCDCLGLVRGVWRECIGAEPETAPPYSPDWAEMTGTETFMEAARRNLKEKPIGDAQMGDVILFRMGLGAPAKHAAIVSQTHDLGVAKIIHAYWGRAVVETHMSPWWERRIAAVFAFPEHE